MRVLILLIPQNTVWIRLKKRQTIPPRDYCTVCNWWHFYITTEKYVFLIEEEETIRSATMSTWLEEIVGKSTNLSGLKRGAT